MKSIRLLPLLLLGACAIHSPPRTLTAEEGRVHCQAAAHSPLVRLGIEPDKTTIMSHTWVSDGKRRMGEYNARSHRVTSINDREPLFHEYIHRGLRYAGERFSNPYGMFRDEEHQLVYYILDRDFPGLQVGRIPKQKRQWAKERWERPEYAKRLEAIEARARAVPGWCERNGQ